MSIHQMLFAGATPAPGVISVATTPFTATNDVSFNMPSGISAGEFLIAVVSNYGSARAADAGWTTQHNAVNTASQLIVATKVATGGDTFVSTCALPQEACGFVLRISGANPSLVYKATGNSQTLVSVNPSLPAPSLSPAPGLRNWLWLAALSAAPGAGGGSLSGTGPAGYTSAFTTLSTVNARAPGAIAYLAKTASTESPGSFESVAPVSMSYCSNTFAFAL